jgi:hypothetical protein
MVMADDPDVRASRLGCCTPAVRDERVADIAQLAAEL